MPWLTYDVDEFPLEIDDFFGCSRLCVELVHPGQVVLEFPRPRIDLFLSLVSFEFLLVLFTALLLCKYV